MKFEASLAHQLTPDDYHLNLQTLSHYQSLPWMEIKRMNTRMDSFHRVFFYDERFHRATNFLKMHFRSSSSEWNASHSEMGAIQWSFLINDSICRVRTLNPHSDETFPSCHPTRISKLWLMSGQNLKMEDRRRTSEIESVGKSISRFSRAHANSEAHALRLELHARNRKKGCKRSWPRTNN